MINKYEALVYILEKNVKQFTMIIKDMNVRL